MKFKTLLLLLIGSGALFFLNSCKDNNDLTEQDVFVPAPEDTIKLGLELSPSSVINAMSVAPDPGWAGALPSKFSLDMPPVLQQGNKGSCVAFATAYAARSYQKFVNFYNSNGSINYSNVCSPEFMYNQIKISDCDKGSYFVTTAGKIGALNLLQTTGVCSWSDMPYSYNSCSTQPNSTQINQASQNKISGFQRVNVNQTNIKNLILNKYPVIFGAVVDDGFMKANSQFIWSRRSGAEKGGHAMVLCGWDDARNAYKIMNSWGTSWGDKGFSWIDYNFASSVINGAFVMTPINSTSTQTRIISLNGDLNFGSVSVGNSQTKVLTIVNQGNNPITISSLSLPNGFSSSYSGSIPANSSVNVNIIFRPTTYQSYAGDIIANANQTSGINRISVSGIGSAGSVTYNGIQTTTNKVTFGGSPYCSYECYFTEITMRAVIANSNIVISSSLSARYTEVPSKGCPYPAIASNVHKFNLLNYRVTNGLIEINFETQEGGPSNFVTFSGRINGNRLEGTLNFTRNDGAAQSTSSFKKTVTCSISLN